MKRLTCKGCKWYSGVVKRKLIKPGSCNLAGGRLIDEFVWIGLMQLKEDGLLARHTLMRLAIPLPRAEREMDD